MTCSAKNAVCSEIRTKHTTQSEHHVEFLNVNPGGTWETTRFWEDNNLDLSSTIKPIHIALSYFLIMFNNIHGTFETVKCYNNRLLLIKD